MLRNLNQHAGEMAAKYFDEFKTLRDLAGEYGVSAMAVQLCLKRNGYDTSKRKYATACTRCGLGVLRIRKRLKKLSGGMGAFCSMTCYHKHLGEVRIGQATSRNGMRIARATVTRLFGPLPPGSIVHHDNGNEDDNKPKNLVLCASQADHMLIHRPRKDGKRPVILWDGRLL